MTEPREDDDNPTVALRPLPPTWRWAAAALGVVIAVTHIYFALFAGVAVILQNTLHFAGFAVLCSLYDPLARPAVFREGATWRYIDLAFGLLVAAAAIHLAFAENAIYDRGVRLAPLDWAAAIIVVVGAVEFTRRTTGFIIPTLIVLAITYVGFWGAEIGGIFAFRGLSWETVLFRSVYGDDAMFGTIARISATSVFLFILFGAFLLRSGAGDFVIDVARIVAGRFVGGPGLVAVIASGLTGTISGSVVANVASTGVITIPLMKRNGYRPAFAAGIESASSTGGQLMPPIMGAGAFVMASYTQIPYETIIAVSVLPALLYFLSVAYYVRIEAKCLGLTAQATDGPTLWQTFRNTGASFVLPVIILITLLVVGFSPSYAAVVGIGAVILSSWLTKRPMGVVAVLEALALGSRNMVLTAVLLCSVGLIVNVVLTAGVGNTFSLMIGTWSGGNLVIAIALVALASLVLGMGLPVTAAYIVLATLSAPALAGMIGDNAVITMLANEGVPAAIAPILMLQAPDLAILPGQPLPLEEARTVVAALPLELRFSLRQQMLDPALVTTALLSAHMIIFWLSQDSNVTPPVCLAAFTAAAIAKSPPMYTGFQSWKVAKGLYIMPLLFAYTPILAGDWLAALQVSLFATIGIYGLVAALQGGMEAPFGPVPRVIAFVAGLGTIWPVFPAAELVGVAVILGLLAWTVRVDRRQRAAAAV